MKSISQLFILSSSGDPIILKNYKRNVNNDSVDTFFARVNSDKSNILPPVFFLNKVYYYSIKRQNVYFVATSSDEMLPIYMIELLTRLHSLCKDFCGIVNEESIKQNFTLVTELIGEFMDCGFLQLTSTEKIKPYIQSDPVISRFNDVSPDATTVPGLFGIEYKTVPSIASNKPVIRSTSEQEMRKNEIFIDVIERLNVLISENGVAQRIDLHGTLTIKSFLVGCSHIKLGFNEDLTTGIGARLKGYGSTVHFDNIAFHESVNLEEFETSRIIKITPPEGEFPALKYQVTGDLPHGLPFRVSSIIQDIPGSSDIEFDLRLLCEMPANTRAINVTATIPVPHSTVGISQHLDGGDGQVAEFLHDAKQVTWKIKQINSKQIVNAHFKLIMTSKVPSNKGEIGPVALNFELSGFVSSNLQIRFIRVYDKEQSYVPLRWIRYVTTSDSYIVKLPCN